MLYSRLLMTVTLLLVGCVEAPRTIGPQQTTGAVSINYPMAALPMTRRARVETVLDLSQLASAQAKRACATEDLEFVELSLIIKKVDYEEWRTKPWTARQKREVEALRRRWQALGGSSREISDPCRAYSSKLANWF